MGKCVGGKVPRLIDPEVQEALIANVAIEKVSFTQSLRSLRRFAKLFGQKYILPKSLRGKSSLTLSEKRRKKKRKKKFASDEICG